jgi:hypothetical protein
MVRITNESDNLHPQDYALKVRDFPLVIGRGGQAGLRLEQAGVWEEHAELRLKVGEGFFVRSCSEALVVLNNQAVSESRLRNGDLLELGGACLRFGFTDTLQRHFRLRERVSWTAIGLLCLGQLVLVYLVLP